MRNLLCPLIACWLAVLAAPPAGAVSPDFEKANAHFGKGEYEEARRLYETLARTGPPNANVFYNLGNADYRLNRKGEAFADYERALRLDPSHPEASANLSLLRAQTGARLETPAWWARALEWPRKAAPFGAAWVAALGFWIMAFGLAPLLWRRKAAWLPAACGGMLLAWFGASAAWEAARGALLIVTEGRGVVRLAPADTSKQAASLPMGSHLRLLLDRGEWLYVRLPDESRGWIGRKAVEPVTPERT